MFIDYIHKYNLIDYGIFSWNELLNEWSNNYEFKFWDEKIVRLDINKERELLDVRKDYFTDDIFNFGCLFNVIGESVDNNDMFFITEKTFKNLLIGQPFICIGSPYQNVALKNFGFRLYENVIDYSFDGNQLILDRVYGVIENLNRIKKKDLNEFYDIMKNDIEYNIDNFYSILTCDNYLPKTLLGLYIESPKSFQDYKNSYMNIDEYLCKILENNIIYYE